MPGHRPVHRTPVRYNRKPELRSQEREVVGRRRVVDRAPAARLRARTRRLDRSLSVSNLPAEHMDYCPHPNRTVAVELVVLTLNSLLVSRRRIYRKRRNLSHYITFRYAIVAHLRFFEMGLSGRIIKK